MSAKLSVCRGKRNQYPYAGDDHNHVRERKDQFTNGVQIIRRKHGIGFNCSGWKQINNMSEQFAVAGRNKHRYQGTYHTDDHGCKRSFANCGHQHRKCHNFQHHNVIDDNSAKDDLPYFHVVKRVDR